MPGGTPPSSPVAPHPESLAAQAAYTEALGVQCMNALILCFARVRLGPELFPGIGVLPGVLQGVS